MSANNFSEAEAKRRSARIERNRVEADQLGAELPDREAEAQALSYAHTAGQFAPSARSKEITERLGRIAHRLREINLQLEDDEAWVREFHRSRNAGPRTDRARDRLSQAQNQLKDSMQAHSEADGAIEKLRAELATNAEVGQAGQNSRVAALLNWAGIKTGSGKSEPSGFDAAAHERRARDFEQALAAATARLEQLARDVAHGHEAVRAAEVELKAAVADVAELEHAQALGAYLPILCKFVAAHAQAHGWRPELPALDSMIEGALPEAEVAFSASLAEQANVGVVAKSTKAARGLLS